MFQDEFPVLQTNESNRKNNEQLEIIDDNNKNNQIVDARLSPRNFQGNSIIDDARRNYIHANRKRDQVQWAYFWDN